MSSTALRLAYARPMSWTSPPARLRSSASRDIGSPSSHSPRSALLVPSVLMACATATGASTSRAGRWPPRRRDRAGVVALEHVGSRQRSQDPRTLGRRPGASHRLGRRLDDRGRLAGSPTIHNARASRSFAAAQRGFASGSTSRPPSARSPRHDPAAPDHRRKARLVVERRRVDALGRSSAGTASHRSIARSKARTDSEKPNAVDAARAAATHARSARTGSCAADAWWARAAR